MTSLNEDFCPWTRPFCARTGHKTKTLSIYGGLIQLFPNSQPNPGFFMKSAKKQTNSPLTQVLFRRSKNDAWKMMKFQTLAGFTDS